MTEPLPFSHPETGELLDSREDFQQAVTELEERLSGVYAVLWPLRNEYAVRFNAVPLPPPRWRTQVQEKVARCPRCGGRLEN